MRMYYGDEGLVDFYENEIFTIDDGSEICVWQKDNIRRSKYIAWFHEIEKKIFKINAKVKVICELSGKPHAELNEEYYKYNHTFRYIETGSMPLHGTIILYKNCMAHYMYDENNEFRVMVYENQEIVEDFKVLFNRDWESFSIKES